MTNGSGYEILVVKEIEMYEVFNPVNGIALYTVDTSEEAKRIATRLGLDYAEDGEGWVDKPIRPFIGPRIIIRSDEDVR